MLSGNGKAGVGQAVQTQQGHKSFQKVGDSKYMPLHSCGGPHFAPSCLHTLLIEAREETLFMGRPSGSNLGLWESFASIRPTRVCLEQGQLVTNIFSTHRPHKVSRSWIECCVWSDRMGHPEGATSGTRPRGLLIP
jgi:hypothetical protein